MPNFKPHNYNQDAMVVVNFEEQLQLDPFAFTLHHLIDNSIDLSAFYKHYKNDEGGRSAYHPSILLKVILFAYSKRIRSTREIQWHCEHNIIFKALSCDTVPHFTSIASFVSSYSKAIESVFEQVLLVCDQQGLLGHELLATDGCKMPSNAAKEHSGTLNELDQKRKKIRRRIRDCMKEHKQLDKRKPREKERKERLEKTLASLDKHFEKIDQFLKTATPRMGQGKRPKEVKSNITDNESGKMKTSKGTIQGYNGVATADRCRRTGISEDIYAQGIVVTADTGFANEANNRYLKANKINAYIPDSQFRLRDPRYTHQKDKYGKRHQDVKRGIYKVIPASDFSFDLKNKTARCPAGKSLWLKGEKATDSGNTRLFFEGKLTDCRQCDVKRACMRNPESANTREGNGRQVSVTVSDGRSATDWMKRRVDSKQGKYYYSHRMSVIEPVFANIGTNKRLNTFSLRSKKKVQGQWQLYCLVHNIEKLMRYGAIR